MLSRTSIIYISFATCADNSTAADNWQSRTHYNTALALHRQNAWMSHKSTPATAIACAPVTRHMCPTILESTPAKPASFWNVVVADGHNGRIPREWVCTCGRMLQSRSMQLPGPPSPDTRPHWMNTCTSGFVSVPTPEDQLWTLASRRCTTPAPRFPFVSNMTHRFVARSSMGRGANPGT